MILISISLSLYIPVYDGTKSRQSSIFVEDQRTRFISPCDACEIERWCVFPFKLKKMTDVAEMELTTVWFWPLLQLVLDVRVSVLQLLDLGPLALDVRAVLVVALLQRAAQLLRGLQVWTQLPHVTLSWCHSLTLALDTAKEMCTFKYVRGSFEGMTPLL